jgi:hypothetical protein
VPAAVGAAAVVGVGSLVVGVVVRVVLVTRAVL